MTRAPSAISPSQAMLDHAVRQVPEQVDPARAAIAAPKQPIQDAGQHRANAAHRPDRRQQPGEGEFRLE